MEVAPEVGGAEVEAGKWVAVVGFVVVVLERGQADGEEAEFDIVW